MIKLKVISLKTRLFNEILVDLLEIPNGLVSAKDPNQESEMNEQKDKYKHPKHDDIDLNSERLGPECADERMPYAKHAQIEDAHNGVLVE